MEWFFVAFFLGTFLAEFLNYTTFAFYLLVGFAFLFLKYIVLVTEYLSKIPGAYLKISGFTILAAVVYWLVLGFVIRWWNMRLKRT